MRGIFSRIIGGIARQWDTDAAAANFMSGGWWSVPSATGISINQQSSLQSTAVMACVRVLAEDISKMPIRLYKRLANGDSQEITTGALAEVLWQPNDWQTQPEFI